MPSRIAEKQKPMTNFLTHMLAKNERNFFPKKLLHNPIKMVLKSELSKQLVATSDYRKRYSSVESYKEAHALIP